MAKTHQMSQTKIYKIWKDMRKRCNNPNQQQFHDYGGRGIKVCNRWNSFENFYKDMGNKPIGKSLDRINNEKGYSPSNCKWVSRLEQNRNKRNNLFIIWNGEKKCLQEWSNITGIHRTVISWRFKRGWPPEKIFAKKKFSKKGHKKFSNI